VVQQRRHAFTLVELIAVMAIIVAIIGLAGPAVNALKGANDVNKAVYDIAGVLQVARSYAMANNTYVYAGIEEASASLDASVSPQVSGTGRLGLAIVATKDGTRGYELSDLTGGGINAATFLADLTSVGGIQVFENLHLVDLGTPPATGNMARPTLTTDASSGFRYELAVPACTSVTPFNYPLGTTGAAAKYTFQKVIQFDPQGVARIQTLNNADTVTSTLEICLQQSHGAAVVALTPPVSTGDVAALQVDAVTGSVHIYRP
jgi:prepilin-type N-terminal cleavage/methylation domain-containing protein